MDANDLIKALQNTLQGGGRPHMATTRPPPTRTLRYWTLVGLVNTVSGRFGATAPSQTSA